MEAETIHREGKCQHQSPNLKPEIQIKWHVHHWYLDSISVVHMSADSLWPVWIFSIIDQVVLVASVHQSHYFICRIWDLGKGSDGPRWRASEWQRLKGWYPSFLVLWFFPRQLASSLNNGLLSWHPNINVIFLRHKSDFILSMYLEI